MNYSHTATYMNLRRLEIFQKDERVACTHNTRTLGGKSQRHVQEAGIKLRFSLVSPCVE